MTADFLNAGIALLAPDEVTPYQASWPREFDRLADGLRRNLGADCALVEHIGGTAVPGLASRGIIDVLLITPSLERIDTRQTVLERLGYASNPGGQRLDQRLFHLGTGPLQQAQLHICQRGSSVALQHLLLRDFLRHNSKERLSYGELKTRLVATGNSNPRAYADGKRVRLVRLLERCTGRR